MLSIAEAFVEAFDREGIKAAQAAERLVMTAQRDAERERTERNFQAFEEMIQKARAERAAKEAAETAAASATSAATEGGTVEWDDGRTTVRDSSVELNPHSGDPVIDTPESANVAAYREKNWSQAAVNERVLLAQQKALEKEKELQRRVAPKAAAAAAAAGDDDNAAASQVQTDRPIFGEKEILSADNFYTDNLKERVRGADSVALFEAGEVGQPCFLLRF